MINKFGSQHDFTNQKMTEVLIDKSSALSLSFSEAEQEKQKRDKQASDRWLKEKVRRNKKKEERQKIKKVVAWMDELTEIFFFCFFCFVLESHLLLCRCYSWSVPQDSLLEDLRGNMVLQGSHPGQHGAW